MDAPPVGASAEAMVSGIRRLSPTQYSNAVSELFDGRLSVGRFDTPEQLFLAAENAAVESVSALPELLPCVADAPDDACVDRFVDEYVARAYRRPVTSAEREGYRTAYQDARQEFSPEESFAVLVHQLLQSAPFVYVAEVGSGPPVDGIIALDDFEIATRIALLFRDSIPDGELWTAAVDGRLHDKEEIERQVRRLLVADSGPFLRSFVWEWLHLAPELLKDSPDFTSALGQSYEEELLRLFQYGLAEGFSVQDLLSVQRMPVNAELASVYEVTDFQPGADGWGVVDLPPRYQGILARPHFLASHAGPADSAPVKRGETIMVQFLCSAPLTAPPCATAREPQYPALSTAREKSEILQGSDPFCAACHAQIDNIGLALEHYDAVGFWRVDTPPHEGSQPIDASGFIAESGDLGRTDLAGATFDGAPELSSLLSSSVDVQRCVTQRFYGHAARRTREAELDATLVDEMVRFVEGREGSLESLFLSITQADAFQYRQLEEP
ncbi:MAG: DUF1592 domain-containing protein [Myxococcota bacterium]